jgi:hypothetical protein
VAVKSLRLQVRFEFPSQTVRLWDGSGPFMDANGDIWKGVTITDGADVVESAINGESATLMMGISGVTWEAAGLAWEEAEAGDVIGSKVQILIQPLDLLDQPLGDPEVRYTGLIDDIIFDDTVQNDNVVSTVMIECVNRFSMRNIASGSVLSNVDQQARSAILNPGADPDRICERLSTLIDKAIRWPVFS